MKEAFFSDIDAHAQRVAYLIAGYIRNRLTEAEHDELDSWVNTSDANMKLFEDLTDENNIAENLQWMDSINAEKKYNELKAIGAFDNASKRRTINFWWAAASVLGILLLAYFMLFKTSGNKSQGQTNAFENLKPVNGNKKNGILLTSENGQVIDLSKLNTGVINLGPSGNGNKTSDSSLVLNGSAGSVMQTLQVPIGKMFMLTLEDGTKIWVNTNTQLEFPSKFAAAQRMVKVSGEAYFEVAHNKTRPFKVYMDDSSSVTVLGTHFNVSAYPAQTKTVSLFEGSVSVSSPGKTPTNLQPGSQAIIKDGAMDEARNIDETEILSWKNGLFVFKDASIQQIMVRLMQWYPIKVLYKSKPGNLFNASFSRSESLEEILKLLELNGNLHFKIENNTVYVLP